MAGGGLRHNLMDLAHAPFQGEIAQRFLWVLGLAPDGVLEKCNQGVHNRFVLQAQPGAVAYLGGERGVLRGLTEDDASYAARVQRAIDDWHVAGSAWAVLGQVLGYLLSLTPAARTVSTLYSGSTPARTQWDYYDAGDATTTPPRHLQALTAEWNWDSLSPTNGSWGWWRWYLVIDSVAPNAWTSPAPKWGATGAKWGGYSGSWGCTSSSNVGKSIRIIVGQWKANICHWIIISFDASEFRPSAGVLPDGRYGRWSKLVGGVYVRSRSSNARYFEGQ